MRAVRLRQVIDQAVEGFHSGCLVFLLRYMQHATAILGANPTDGGGSMAFWSKKEPDFEEMDRIIRECPGIRPAELARHLDLARSTVQRRLPSMEEAGYLYSEDEQGGLWPYTDGN
jgi:DNA-binding transcriptional ArsR family regulator